MTRCSGRRCATPIAAWLVIEFRARRDESEPARTVLLGLDRAIAQAAEAVDHQEVNNGGDMVRDTREEGTPASFRLLQRLIDYGIATQAICAGERFSARRGSAAPALCESRAPSVLRP
jgi:hypothetical protein